MSDESREQQVTRLIAGLPVGRTWGRKAMLYVRRPTADEYILVAVQPLPEVYDEDPGRVGCGCDHEGRSHGHAERTYSATEMGSLVAAYIEADTDMQARRAPAFARMERIG